MSLFCEKIEERGVNMANKAKIRASIVLDGEKEFKDAVSSCNKKITTLRSELKLTKETYAENANSLEALTEKEKVLTKILEEQKNKQAEVAKGQQHAIAEKEKLKSSIATLSKEQEQAVKKLEEMKNSSKTSSREMKAQQKQIETLSEKIVKGNENLQRAEKRIEGWSSKLNSAKADVIKANRALQENRKYLEEAKTSIDQCAKSIDRYGKKINPITKEVREVGEQSKEAFDTLASTIVASGAAEKVEQVASALYDCSEAAGAFETVSAKVSTIADTTKVSMKQLDEEMLALSTDTGQAVSNIGESVYQAISASVDTSKAVGTVSTATKAAVGGFTDTNTAIDGLTTVLNSYGDKVKDATEVSDVFITVQDLGKTSFGELASSIGKVSTNAALYNVSIQNLGTAYIELTKRGIQTSEATTYTNSLLKELAKDSSKVSGILQRKTGKSFSELTKEGKSLGDVIGILSESVGGNTTAFANLFSSQEAGTAAAVLLKTGTEEYNKTLQEVEKSAGATEEAYQKMANTSDYAKQKMLNGIENLKIAIGKELNESLDGLYEKGGNVIEWATEFIEKNPLAVKAVVAFSAGVGTLTTAFVTFTTVTKVLIPLIQSFGTALAANPVGAVAVAVSTLVTIIGTFVAMQKQATEATDQDSIAEEKNIQLLKEKNEATKENINTAKEKISTAEAEAYSVDMQIGRLLELNKEEKKSTSQKSEMKTLIESLSGKIPELSEAYDEETGVLQMQNSEIKKLAENYKQLYLTQAAQEDMAAIYKEQYNAQKNLDDAQSSLAKSMEKVSAARKKAEKATKAWKEEVAKNSNNPNYNENNSETYQKALQLEREYENIKAKEEKKQKKYNTLIKDAEKNIRDCNAEVERATKYIEEYGTSAEKAANKQKKTASEAKKTEKAYSNLENAFEQSKKSLKGYGKNISKDLESGIDKAIKIAKKAGVKIPSGLAKGLKNGSKAPGTAVNELNKATSNKLLELVQQAREMGIKIPEEIEAGLSSGTLDVTETYEFINEQILLRAKKQEKRMEEAGLKITKKMKKGYEAGGQASIEAIQASKKIIKKLMNDAGVDSMEELKKGIEEGIPRVIKACENAASEVSGTYKNILGLETSSKKSETSDKKAKTKDNSKSKKQSSEPKTKQGALDIAKAVIYDYYGEEKEAGSIAQSAAKKAKEAAQKELKKQNGIVKKAEDTISTKKLNQSEAIKVWAKAVKETKKGTDAHIKALRKYKQAKEKLLKDEKKLKKEFKENFESLLKDLKSKIKDYKQQIKELENTYKEAVESTQSSIAGAWGMFSKADISKTNNAEGLIRNIKTQAEAVEAYKKNMDKLRASGLSEELIKELESTGISSAGDIATLAAMSASQLKEYQSYYDIRQSYAKQEAVTQNNDLKVSTAEQVAKLEKKMLELEEKYKKKIDKLEAKYKKQMKKLGKSVSNSLIKGIEEGSSSVYKSIAKMTGQTVKQVKKSLGVNSVSALTTSTVKGKADSYSKIVKGLQQETKQIDELLAGSSVRNSSISRASESDILSSQSASASAPVELNMYMDSQKIASATFSVIDLMQGANIKLLNRGLTRG